MNKILFIAPLPPNFNGQTKISKAVLDLLIKECNNCISIIDTNKSSNISGFNSFKRLFEVFIILFKIYKNRKAKKLIYLSLSESFSGNIKDIFTFFICYQSLDKMVIHMLGGANLKKILNNKNLISKINQFFHKKVKAIIVEGSENYNMFLQHVHSDKIHIVPNFVDNYIFSDVESIKNKFNSLNKLNLLYLSNLLPGKGYYELTKAFIELDSELRKEFSLTFVGGFDNEEDKINFLSLISPFSNIFYLGEFIDGIFKKNLYDKSHIFCLPTYYPFEGQPISILEGYASGMVVMTTNHSGIPMIFDQKTNGYLVRTKSIESIKKCLQIIFEQKKTLYKIANSNFIEAKEKYVSQIFENRIKKIILNEAR
jgi:glycosyltransferase involved in cell wall biosynthesis